MNSGSSAQDFELARAGDRQALDRILIRSRPRLEAVAQRLVGPTLREKVSISDVIQSTYLQVVQDVARFDGHDDDAFAAWLGRIFENTVRQKHRFFSAKKRLAPADAAEQLARRRPRARSPSSLVGSMEDIVLVGRAMDRLSEDHHRVIRLRVVEGRSIDEIAMVMKRTQGAAKMLLSRARAALTLEIEALENEGA